MSTRLTAAPLLGLAVLFAACSSGAASPAGSVEPATATPAPASSAPSEAPSAAASEPPAAGAASVALAENALGTVLVDGEGKTLYLFMPDTGGTPTCYDECATAWPPLLSDGTPTAGDGLTAADLGSATRTDGDVPQVTFKGWPLYYFAGDAAAGDTAGQGLNGVWWVVGADGAAIGAGAMDGVAVNVATTSLGDILVDGDGRTLYMFTSDSDGQSACTGDCVANWPPLVAESAPTLGEGLDAADFGTIARDDGTMQVTFFGMPLYAFSGDQAAGDVNGQGVGERWYVLAADGTVVK